MANSTIIYITYNDIISVKLKVIGKHKFKIPLTDNHNVIR